MALINSAESQGFRFLFVSVPETDQHKKQKSGKRKGDQANQNATNHSCLLPLYVAGRLRIRTSSRPSCCSAASTARAKRGYNCGLLERRRLDDGASSSVIIHVFDVADQITDDF